MALVGVEDGASEGVQLLALVELPSHPGTELLVGQPLENEVRLDQPPVLLQGLGELVAPRAGLQAGEQQAGGRPAVSQRIAFSEAHRRRTEAVVEARRAGLSWELIARELGLTKQGAWEQFRRFCEE